jgi:hypothetical protein
MMMPAELMMLYWVFAEMDAETRRRSWVRHWCSKPNDDEYKAGYKRMNEMRVLYLCNEKEP